MKILSISRADNADICNSIIDELRKRGHTVLKAAYVKKSKDQNFFSLYQPKLEDYFNKIIIRLTGEDGFHSKRTTRSLVKTMAKFHPDAVIIHYLHQNFIDFIPVMKYCDNNNVPVVFVANDTWIFTGRCAYFEMNGCYKWRTGCGRCPFPREYPKQIICDHTHKMWLLKKEYFAHQNVTIVSPSNWLADYLKQSFFDPNQIHVIRNGTDFSSYYRRNGDQIRQMLGLKEGEHLVFCAARTWTKRKGLDIINQIAKTLPPSIKVAVHGMKKNQITDPKIIRIEGYLSKDEMAKYFSAADIFLNPTQDEVWGLVNIESLACGTPIAGFLSSGSQETFDNKTGIAVPLGNAAALQDALLSLISNPLSKDDCIARAHQFTLEKMSQEYADLIEKASLK